MKYKEDRESTQYKRKLKHSPNREGSMRIVNNPIYDEDDYEDDYYTDDRDDQNFKIVTEN